MDKLGAIIMKSYVKIQSSELFWNFFKVHPKEADSYLEHFGD